MLYRAGMLSSLFTDICAVKDWPSFLNLVPETFRPAGLRRLLARVPEGIPRKKLRHSQDSAGNFISAELKPVQIPAKPGHHSDASEAIIPVDAGPVVKRWVDCRRCG